MAAVDQHQVDGFCLKSGECFVRWGNYEGDVAVSDPMFAKVCNEFVDSS